MALTDEVPLLVMSRNVGKNDSPWVSVFNICNCAIGAGVLSFPYGFRQTGLLGGLFFTALICFIEMSTLRILIRVAEKSNSPSYQHLVHTFLGQNMEVVTSLVIVTLLVGGNISYFIIAGDVFTPLFAEQFGEDLLFGFGTRRLVILFLGLAVVLPLSLQTTLKALKYSSMVSVIMLSYLSMALIAFGVVQIVRQGFPKDVVIFEAGIRTFITLDIVVFAFQSHVQIVAIFAELSENPNPFFKRRKDTLLDEEKSLDDGRASEISAKGQRSERLKRMDGVIIMSMTICFILYTLVGEFGYLIFPEVESDVLSSFGNKNFFMNLARVGMAVVAMVCYPIQNHPARSIMDDAIKYVAKLPATDFSIVRHVLITVVFFSFTIGVALMTSDIGKVFSLLGSTGGVTVAFIIPGTLLFLGFHNASGANTDVRMIKEEAPSPPKRSRSQACMQGFVGSCIVVFGVIIFITTIYVNITDQMTGSS